MEIEFGNYADGLFRFALSLTRDFHAAEDLVQDCMLRAHKSANQLNDAQAVKSWLFRIMVNLFRDEARRRQATFVDYEVDETGGRVPAPDEAGSA